MNTETTVKSRTEWLAKFQRKYGTDYLLDVIREARVGVSNAFMDTSAMDTVIRTAKRMLAEKEEKDDTSRS
ncbi:hypothetical protein LCGC14_1237780 [marine sediment metagenome]|uniref:Uncharacterized protein n=1 Tax=marine sediment metagenome TaxID=412755 RepID=A0A0F9LAS4_9ZZZZ